MEELVDALDREEIKGNNPSRIKFFFTNNFPFSRV